MLLNALHGHVAMNTIHWKIGPVLNGQTNAQLNEVQVYNQSGHSGVHLSNSLLVMSVPDVQGRVLSRCFGLDLDNLFGQALFHYMVIQMLAVEGLIQHILRLYTEHGFQSLFLRVISLCMMARLCILQGLFNSFFKI